MKERFTGDEWELLKVLPFQVFGLVAGSDGVIDRKERKALERQLRSAEVVANPLHRSLLHDILLEDIRVHPSASPSRMPGVAKSVKAVLRSHLDEEEYRDFIDSLFLSGLDVAHSSRGLRLGFGSQVSATENAALAAFAVQYELDSSAVRRRLGLDPHDH